MINAISDFMIHVDESLDKQARETMEVTYVPMPVSSVPTSRPEPPT